MTAPMRRTQRGPRIGGLARLREHEHRAWIVRMPPQGRRPTRILARVLHINDQSREIFEQNLRRKPRMTTRSARRDDEVRMLAKQRGNSVQWLVAEGRRAARKIEVVFKRPRNDSRLFIDLAQHVVAKAARRGLRHHT